MRCVIVLVASLALVHGSWVTAPVRAPRGITRLRPLRCSEAAPDEPGTAASTAEGTADLQIDCDFPGCDGKGRAMGGLAAIELFSWWPIKVR